MKEAAFEIDDKIREDNQCSYCPDWDKDCDWCDPIQRYWEEQELDTWTDADWRNKI